MPNLVQNNAFEMNGHKWILERVDMTQSADHLLDDAEVVAVGIGMDLGGEWRDARISVGAGVTGVLPHRRAFDVGVGTAVGLGQLTDWLAGLVELVQWRLDDTTSRPASEESINHCEAGVEP